MITYSKNKDGGALTRFLFEFFAILLNVELLVAWFLSYNWTFVLCVM